MAIEFTCPAGHKLSCRESLAGKPGKCPKCGAGFLVPQPRTLISEDDEYLTTGEPFELARLDFQEEAPVDRSTSPVRTEGPAQPAAPADAIVFLCPNGHRLHGALHLIGKPGQCPHCNARFLVPSPDDIPEDDEIPEIRPGGLDAEAPRAPAPARSSGTPAAALAPRLETTSTLTTTSHLDSGAARIFDQLWAEKTLHGAVVEVHLADGRMFVPEQYASAASRGSQAVFAEREANGTYRVTVIPWTAVARLTVRGLPSLPGAIFTAG